VYPDIPNLLAIADEELIKSCITLINTVHAKSKSKTLITSGTSGI